MNKHTNNLEMLAAGAHAASLIGLLAHGDEKLHAQGVYHGELRSYKPQHAREYVSLFEYREELRRVRPHDREHMLRVREHILQIDAYLPTLEETRALVAPNVVTTLGGNYLLDNGLAGSAFTAAFYMGLLSSISYGAGPVVGDTAASHAGWTEAGVTNAPTYTGARKSAAWAAASGKAKALSAGLVFTFTGTGTVKGCFLGTASAVDATTGVLYSAGLFTGGDQPVVSTNTLTVSYTASV